MLKNTRLTNQRMKQFFETLKMTLSLQLAFLMQINQKKTHLMSSAMAF